MRKLVAFVVAIVLATAVHNLNVEAAVQFKDISQKHDAWEEIQYLLENKIITGYQDNTFRPNQPVKRVQAITMLGRALQWDTSNIIDPNFTDIEKGTEAYGYIAVAVEKGILQNGTKFNPNGTLTRAQMAKILSETFQLKTNQSVTFSDVTTKHWAKDFIKNLAGNQITTGYPNGTFQPERPTTRVQFSLFLARALDDQFKKTPMEKVANAPFKFRFMQNERVYTECPPALWDKNVLCTTALDGTDFQLSNIPFGTVAKWGSQYFVSTDDGRLLVMNLDGTNERTIITKDDIPEKYSYIYMSGIEVTEDWIYLSIASTSQYEGAIYKVKHDGSNLTKVHNKPHMNPMIIEGELWFLEEYYYSKLTKLDKNGKKIDFEISARTINYVDGWVYFDTQDQPYNLYRMKPDGTNKQLLAKEVNPNSSILADQNGLFYFKNIKDKGNDIVALYANSLDGKKEKLIKKFDNGGVRIYGVWGDFLHYKENADPDEYVMNLKTGSITKIIKPDGSEVVEEILPNELVEKLEVILPKGYKVERDEHYPNKDAEVWKGKQKVFSISNYEEGRELTFNVFDESEAVMLDMIDAISSLVNWEDKNQLKENIFYTIETKNSITVEEGSQKLVTFPSGEDKQNLPLLIVVSY